MALLRRKSSPIAEAEAELSDLTSRREVLEQKFDKAHAALAAAINERRTSLLDADLDDATAATRRDAVVRGARDRVEAIGDALQEIERKIADATTRLAELRDHAEREQIAAAVTSDAAALEVAAKAFADASTALIPIMTAVVGKVPNSAVDFAPRISQILGEIPVALSQLVADARGFAARTASGSEPLRRAPPPAPKTVELPQIERTEIYALAPLRWTERGQTLTCPRYGMARLPADIAARAITANLADTIGSPRAKKLQESFGLIHGPCMADDCTDLDPEAPAAQQPQRPRLPPGFKETIGPARMMEIAVNRT
jgi:hypothetical protein